MTEPHKKYQGSYFNCSTIPIVLNCHSCDIVELCNYTDSEMDFGHNETIALVAKFLTLTALGNKVEKWLKL